MFYRLKDVQLSVLDRFLRKLILFDYYWKNSLINIAAKALFTPSLHSTVKKVLILRKGGLGDGVTALPALQTIRAEFPFAVLELLTNKRPDWQAGIDDIIEPDFFSSIYQYQNLFESQLIRKIRSRKYDLYIELSSNISSVSFSLRSMAFARACGIPSGIGWQISSTKLFRKKQEKWLQFTSERQRLVHNLRSKGFTSAIDPDAEILRNLPSEKVAVEIVKAGLNSRQKNIALLIGAGRSQNKWPEENFKKVADFFLQQGYNLLLIGGQKEKKLAENLKSGNTRIYDFCAGYTPREQAALLSNCCLAIGNDTGTMHIAYSAGTPVIALFSSRDYAGKWFPPEKQNTALRNNTISCAACLGDKCSYNACLRAITTETVIGEATALLERYR